MRTDYDLMDTCIMVQAKDVVVGDTVRFRASFADYMVEDIETDSIGQVRHRAGNDTRTCSYHPGEYLWVDKRTD